MNKLIDSDVLTKEIAEIYNRVYSKTIDQCIHDFYNSVCKAIRRVPNVDVEPVVHGKWVSPTLIGSRYFNVPHCSVCGEVPCGVDENTRYCPNCGANMYQEVDHGKID